MALKSSAMSTGEGKNSFYDSRLLVNSELQCSSVGQGSTASAFTLLDWFTFENRIKASSKFAVVTSNEVRITIVSACVSASMG